MSDKYIEEKEVLEPYRAALRNQSLLVRVIFALTAIIITLLVLVVSLFPLKHTELKVIEYVDGTNNFLRILRPNSDLKSKRALLEMFLKKYVRSRELVDQITELQRAQFVKATSSTDVFNAYSEIYLKPMTGLYRRRGFKRAVEITNIQAIPKTSFYQVYFRTTDIDEEQGGAKGTSYWVATIAYSLKNIEVKFEEKDLNPMGLVIDKYSLNEFDKATKNKGRTQ